MGSARPSATCCPGCPCPAQLWAGRQRIPSRSWGAQMSLRTATYPARAGNDPPNPCPSITIIGRHREELPLPSRFLLSYHAGNEHPSHHSEQAGGEALPRAELLLPALYPATAGLDPAPEAASAHRAHRNLLCPIRASPWELGARAGACPARGDHPAMPEGLGEGNEKTTGQKLV